MIACVCADISDKEIVELVREGKTLFEIQRETNAGLGCGVCYNTLKILTGECDEDDCGGFKDHS